jgi:ElaA protein
MIDWKYIKFNNMSTYQLYKIMKLRQDVFIIEQNLNYRDLDGLDLLSGHLFGQDNNELIAYLRVVPPGEKYDDPSLGRIVVKNNYRGNGLGYELVRKGIYFAEKEYGKVPIQIRAQAHLENFYTKFNFHMIAGPFESDGVPHIQMLRY